MKEYQSLCHTRWDCKYHVVGGREKNFTGEVFWARGYFVSTVGLDEAMVKAYIRNQEHEDEHYDQMKLGV